MWDGPKLRLLSSIEQDKTQAVGPALDPTSFEYVNISTKPLSIQ